MSIERRRFERFEVMPMYTDIAVRRLDETTFTREGHAYDVSEGGIRFELDIPIDPGTPIAARLMLPELSVRSAGGLAGGPAVDGPGRAVFLLGNVVWCRLDEDEPGPCQMAITITRFARLHDRRRLLARLGARAVRRVA